MRVSDSTKHNLAQLAKSTLPVVFFYLSVFVYDYFIGELNDERVLVLIALGSFVIMFYFNGVEYRLKYKLGLTNYEWQTFTSRFCAFISRQLRGKHEN